MGKMSKLVKCMVVVLLVNFWVNVGRPQKCPSSGCSTGQSQGTAQYPYGDENVATNMLDKTAGHSHCAKEVQFAEQKLPCRPKTDGIQDVFVPCPKDGAGNLYSSAAVTTPEVFCKRCDIRKTPDDSGVIIQCIDCSELPLSKGIMWSKKLLPKVHPLLKRTRLISSKPVPATAVPETPARDFDNFKVGYKVHGFEVTEVQDVSEFKLTAIRLTHERTKSEYLHLYRNDNNNVFSVNFRTTPLNSTGLPHILEHTVLCGSEMFPVKDPFFKMLNRSLATFMNAMTGSDFTLYPFSTQNMTDYRNLQKIYLDAVFRPNLKELDFMQEGWRLENLNLKDAKSPLVVKGVVYNEMKGVFSENETILAQRVQNLLLPDHTYGVISGGDPMKIPDLTWDDLKNFHAKHYHPSNARFYSYGNFPLTPSLEYINGEYLSKYDFEDTTHTLVPSQKRWNETKTETIYGRFEKMREPFEKQNSIAIALAMTDITNSYETFLLQFLCELLIKGPNSPFYKSMIEPNFSGGFSPSTGFDTQSKDSIFIIGLQGIHKDDFQKVIDIFDNTIDNVIRVGFDDKHIESVLHRFELAIKHESSNFGLNLLMNLTPLWNHTYDVISGLQVNQLISRLKKELSRNNKYLQNAVEKYFKDNQHKLILTMSPDKNYEVNLEKEEKKLIHNKVKNLTEDDKQVIYQKCLQLEKEQSLEQNTNVLPTLVMDDIGLDVERIPIEKLNIGPVPVQVNKVNSNGIVYFKGILNTSDLSVEQQMLLPIFCYVINKMGSEELNYREFDSLVNRKTAGLDLNVFVGESLYQLHSYEPGLYLSSYCLEKNLDGMWDLWNQLFNLKKLADNNRFQVLVQLYMSNLTHGLVDSGHIYAMQAAGGLVSGTSYQKELLSGLQHISYMKRLLHMSNYPAMLKEIMEIAKLVFNKNRMRCALNLRPDTQQEALKSFEQFISQIPGHNQEVQERTYVTGKVWAPKDAVHCQHHILNTSVHFCSKSILAAPYTHPDYAKLRVLSRLLTAKYLHPEVREKQGAYGGGAKISTDGVFSFYSYRDPHNLKTLDAFDNSYNWALNELDKITQQDILEAKLGVFQSVDSPIPPSSKGCDEFFRRLTPDILQKHRADLILVNKDALRDVADRYLSKDSATLSGKVVLGPKGEWDTSKRASEMWTVVENV